MADAVTVRARATALFKSVFGCALLAMIAAPVAGQERFGALSVAREDGPTRGLQLGGTRQEVVLRWRSADDRFGIALIDNGVSLRTALTGYDQAGRQRCSSTGPLLVYDSADWMDLRWRTLIEEHGNFLRTCHVIDQHAAREYRGQFLRDAARFPAALVSFKAEVREMFGPSLARCFDFRDGSDIPVAGRDRCERMIER